MSLMRRTKWKHRYYCGNCGYNFWDDAPTECNDDGIPFCPVCGCLLDGSVIKNIRSG